MDDYLRPTSAPRQSGRRAEQPPPFPAGAEDGGAAPAHSAASVMRTPLEAESSVPLTAGGIQGRPASPLVAGQQLASAGALASGCYTSTESLALGTCPTDPHAATSIASASALDETKKSGGRMHMENRLCMRAYLQLGSWQLQMGKVA